MQAAPALTGWSRYGSLGEPERIEALLACRKVADTLCPGLDLSDEIGAVNDQRLGDTVLLQGADGLAAFAICHYGPSSEAGADACFVKFGAVRDTPSVRQDYRRLLEACAGLAREAGMPNLSVGVNLARREAYEELVARGFRTVVQGVAMHRRDDPGYCRPGVYILDDWR